MTEQPRGQDRNQQSPSQEQIKKLAEQQMAQEAATSQRRRKKNRENQNENDIINPEQVRDRLKKSLRAAKTQYKKTDNGKVIPVLQAQEKYALVKTEEGFRKIWATISGCISKAAAGAYTDRNDEFKAGFSVMTSLLKQMWKKHEEWGIETVEDADQIADLVAFNLKMTLSKARGGRAMKHGETIRDIREFRNDGDQDQDKKWFNMF